MKDDFVCPHCGAEVVAGATFCRACGASDECGWPGEDAAWEGDGIVGYGEDDDFDYDEFVRREFPASSRKPRGNPVYRWFIVTVVLVLTAALLGQALM